MYTRTRATRIALSIRFAHLSKLRVAAKIIAKCTVFDATRATASCWSSSAVTESIPPRNESRGFINLAYVRMWIGFGSYTYLYIRQLRSPYRNFCHSRCFKLARMLYFCLAFILHYFQAYDSTNVIKMLEQGSIETSRRETKHRQRLASSQRRRIDSEFLGVYMKHTTIEVGFHAVHIDSVSAVTSPVLKLVTCTPLATRIQHRCRPDLL